MSVTASQIAFFLEEPLHGPDIVIDAVRALNDVAPNSLVYAVAVSPDVVEKLNVGFELFALVPKEHAGSFPVSHVGCRNPRLAFAQVVNRFFVTLVTPVIAPTAILGD